MTDNINHPQHYTSRNIGYECIDLTQYQTFCAGNALKYLWRYQDKGKPLEDLEKARWYAYRASTGQETVNLEDGHCKIILDRLIETTTDYESALWYGLRTNNWLITLGTLDVMIERLQDGAQTL